MTLAFHDEAVKLFASMATELHVEKGVFLDSNYVYYLKKGLCSLSFFTDGGEKHSYLFFQEGEMFNFLPAIRKMTHKHSLHLLEKRSRAPLRIYTSTKCTLLAVESSYFGGKLDEHQELQKLLLFSCSENLGNLLIHTTAMTTANAAARLAFMILENMSLVEPFILPAVFTYNELGAYLSLHPVTVTKIFKALMREGIIVKNGKDRVVANPEALEDIARERRMLAY